MIVCVCHRVSDRDITRASAACGSFAALQFELGVGTRCGRCINCAHELFREHSGACESRPQACSREAVADGPVAAL